ncbi:MAG: DUF429 domain-containing protein [Nocardioides sp.]|uniref:DUF429 domain-containing protein n=1 Tax=Nocardioides sp. TaxID=35761 RepID=UPI003F08449D
MHVVGVDLAWGGRRPTGLAVLDAHGRLAHLSSVTDDDEIVSALDPYVADACLVAFDAPLIVVNATGNRPAEAALNRDFARFDAGAHPSNTGKPEFAGKPRGARLAGRLGLDMNPRSGRARRALEVYPHPATVALFGLGRTLKYKNKPGRTLDQLRSELLVLMGLLEGLARAEVPLRLDEGAAAGVWSSLRSDVAGAGRKSEVRVVEDQVDAVVCAYVGLLAVRTPEALTTYGDFENGYIVTPTLPAGHSPAPRRPAAEQASQTPAAPTDTSAAVSEYARRQPALKRATTSFTELITSVLDEAGINYLAISGRTKSVASFAGKARRTVDGVPMYAEPLEDIGDQIGLRVITYAQDDVTAVAHLIHEQFVVHDDRDLGLVTASEGRFGYASRHLHIGLGPDDAAAHPELADLVAQVQLRTVLQHAWAEFEHDIRYKGTVPDEHVPDLDRRFTLAAGLLELADREFSTIRAKLRESLTSAGAPETGGDPRISARELAAFLAGQYSDAGWSRTEHYDWIGTLVLELGITSLTELGETLRGVDEETLAERMDYRYPPAAVRRLDDALLWAHGETYVSLHANAHRVDALRARLAKMRASD